MKRFFLAALMGLLIGNLAFAASTDVKSQIGTQDLKLDDDGTAHGTFTRRTSTGGLLTLDKIDGNQIPWSLDYSRTIRPGDIIAKGPWVDVRAYGAKGDDITDDTTSFNNAIASLSETKGALYVPPGIYRLSPDNIVITGLSRSVFGSGNSSQLHFVGTGTSGLKFTNASRGSLSNIYINSDTTVTYALNITASTSTASFDVSNVWVNGGTNAVAIGPDVSVDVSAISLYKVLATAYTNAGFYLGNGTSGNVLVASAVNCNASTGTYGIYYNGGSLTWNGGSFDTHSGADVYLNKPSSNPIIIQGIRSEGSLKFIDSSSGQTSAGTNVTLIGNETISFTQASGIVLSYKWGIPLTIIGCTFIGGPVDSNIELSGISSPSVMPITAMNNVVDNAATFWPAGALASTWLNLFHVNTMSMDSDTSATRVGEKISYYSGNYSSVGLIVKEGSNAKMGSASLASGTATVSTTAVTNNSRILLTSQSDAGTPGFLRVSGRTAATSFTITSSSATDNSAVGWLIVEPQ